MKTEDTYKEKKGSWIRTSVMFKVIIIIVLMLLLLIPSSMIKSIITEREHLHNEAVAEVSSKWAESQQVNGPILTIPLVYEYEKEYEYEVDGKSKKGKKKVTAKKYWYILPENLNIKGSIDPEKLRRGIYEVVVYKSGLSISGDFVLDQHIDKTNLKKINYDEAFLTIGISDLRGLKNKIDFKWGEQKLEVEPGSKIPDLIYSGVTISLPDIKSLIGNSVDFEFALNLQGSQNMSFVPIGGITEVKLSSSWDSPSFNGNFLPDTRELSAEGFIADWKILQLNRNLPQSFIGQKGYYEKMQTSTFGVDLILPLDDYQKTMRSAKYAVMTIALTFLIFFLVEILNKRRIHPFQYALVGLALCVFYILLVSITEHSNFNIAYAISTFGVVLMITLYSLSVFKVKKLSLLLVATLLAIYGFLFVILQLADYALLMGSIGLALILGLTMYFTRNINWYKLNMETD